MDEIPSQRPARRLYVRHNQHTRAVPNPFAFNAAQSRSSRRRRARKAQGDHLPVTLRAQAAELRSARTNLERAYSQEHNIQSLSSRSTSITFDFPHAIAARAKAERRYVKCLIRYLRGTNQMGTVEATEMRRNFTRQKMRAAGVSNGAYLLGMYPQELK